MRSTSTSSTRTFITPTVTPEVAAPKPRHNMHRLSASVRARKNLPWVIVGVLVLFSLFLYVQFQQAQHKLQSSDSGAANTKQVASLVSKVAKLIIVPAHETPTVATVTNASKLKTETFFANAQNGDKVLVYSQQKEAILYRPSTNQLVTVAPVDVSATGDSTIQGQ